MQNLLPHEILIISGFDATASAGILFDAHVCKVLNTQPCCILPNFLTQNHNNVSDVILFSQENIMKQLQQTPLPKFVKIGLMYNAKTVKVIADFLKNHDTVIILDTPIISSSGKQLVDDIPSYVVALKKYLLPLVTLLTPNLNELPYFGTIEDILLTGCTNVLLKGGHLESKECTDTLYNKDGKKDFTLPRIAFKENVRGTGCALSTAITCNIAQGLSLEEAITKAKHFVHEGIQSSIQIDNKTRVIKF